MKKIITYGTFDLFHIGHLRLIQRAKALGDHLTVAVSTDDFNALKGKKTLIPFEHRIEIVKNVQGVDEVIPEGCWEQKKRDIQQLGITHFVMGADWQGKFDELKSLCEIVYLPRTPNISSSEIKSALAVLNQLVKDLD